MFIIPSIFLFKKDINNNKEIDKLKELTKFFLFTMLLVIMFFVSASIYLYHTISLDSCGRLCQNYTNNWYKVLLGLIIQIINITIYYLIYKNVLLKFHSIKSKLKYLLVFIYATMILCTSITGIFIYNGFLGHFIINNILLHIFRWITIIYPLIIYPLDIFIIERIKN